MMIYRATALLILFMLTACGAPFVPGTSTVSTGTLPDSSTPYRVAKYETTTQNGSTHVYVVGLRRISRSGDIDRFQLPRGAMSHAKEVAVLTCTAEGSRLVSVDLFPLMSSATGRIHFNCS